MLTLGFAGCFGPLLLSEVWCGSSTLMLSATHSVSPAHTLLAGTTTSAVKGAGPHSTSSALNKGKSPVPGVSAVRKPCPLLSLATITDTMMLSMSLH